MSQIPLFASRGETVLVDDQRGRVTYLPDVVSADVADRWFVEVRDTIEWRSERRRMYDRMVDVPRLTEHFRLTRDVPGVIQDAAQTVIAATGVTFNSVGLNFYRDGRDSVAPHNDDLDEIAQGHPIVLLSLGATRQMTIRANKPPRRVLHVDLAPGSLLVMGWETQLHYTHAIPKTPDRVGPRISLAFRVKRGAEP